jgi:dihydropyrimidinase
MHHEMRTLIANGIVVNAEASRRADVLVEDETITALIEPDRAGGPPGVVSPVREPGSGVVVDRVIDARGRLVIPGGIDPHTHMELPVAGTVSRDDFETGTRAAAFGGTTTIIDFAGQTRGRPLREGLETWMARAEGRCAIDYGFHMMVNDVNPETLAEMDVLVAEGITTFKLFTAYPGVQLSDDGAILRAMLRTAENGGLVLMHAENGVAIDVLAARYAETGHTDPWFHGISRPAGLEAECVGRVIRLAEAADVPVYIVHLSSRDALEEVVRGRQRGARAYAETCPQYLFLTLDDLRGGFDGARFVCSPPLRPTGHQDALWEGLARNDLHVVGTDHCPFDFAGQKDMGRDDFRRIPNGLPGVEERLDLVFQGVLEGRISRERWVEICSTAAARMFGLQGRKGAVAPGHDADIVIYDPERRHVLSAASHHMAVDYSCYEGLEVQGGSDIVMSRGRVIVEDGRYLGHPGAGRFLPRAPSWGDHG